MFRPCGIMNYEIYDKEEPMSAVDSNRKWRQNRPKAAKAHIILNWEVECGRIVHQPCEVCGKDKTHGHHDDYSKPLEVRWLCPYHHRKLHPAEHKGKAERRYVPGLQRRSYYHPSQLPLWHNRKKRQPAPLRDQLLNQARELRNSGKSYQAIATELGTTAGTVYKWLNPKDYA